MRKAGVYTIKRKETKEKKQKKKELKKLTDNENKILKKAKKLIEIGQGEDFTELAFAQDNIIDLSITAKERMDIREIYIKCKNTGIEAYNTIYDIKYIYSIDKDNKIKYYRIENFKNIIELYKSKINKAYKEYLKEKKLKNY